MMNSSRTPDENSPVDAQAPLQASPQVPERQTPPVGARAVIRSADMLGQAQSVEIEHLGQIYRLQSTRAGKLILTK